MSRKKRSEISSKGGSLSGGNFKNDRKRASAAGRKGAEAQSTAAKAKGGRNSHRGE
jgi:general stress protein YciG